jgi:Tol biopolymer transport system component
MWVFPKAVTALCTVLIFAEFGCKNPVDWGGGFPTKAGPILFISDKSGTSQLYSMDDDGSNVRQLTNDPKFPIFQAAWSPDGKKISVASSVGGVPLFGYAIYIMNSDGTDRYLLTEPRFGGSYAGATGARWSPDSKEIAFNRTSHPEPIPGSDIFIIDVDGNNERRFIMSPTVLKYATDWSRDGECIAVHEEDWTHRDSTTDPPLPPIRKVLYDLQGVEVRSWHGGGDLIYSTAGGKIAYDTIGAVIVMNADGSNVHSVKYNSDLFMDIRAWSQDDTKLLCEATTNGYDPNKVFLMNLQTSELTDITPYRDYSGRQSAQSWRRR